jgi:alpha-tubulin suppressor-like RCC1 family protein
MPTPYSNKPKITSTDIANGYVTRYFVRHISIKVVIEIDKKQYEAFKNNVLYEKIDFPWVITGFANDILSSDGKIIYGTKHKNTVTTQFYDKKLPGLTRLLKNPLEYFQGTRNPEFIVLTSQPTYNSDVAGTGTGRTFTNWTFIPPVVTPPTSSSYTVLNLAQGESSTFVLRSDNTLWSWGWNGEGELGLGLDTVSYENVFTPTQVTGAWNDVQAGPYNMFAIKSDNTLWAAGSNTDGQLGVGDTANKNSMTQVSGTNWSKVAPSINYGTHTLGLKTTGTLWAWGDNANGELGNGMTGGNETSPIQIGSDTNWSYIHAAYLRSFAIKTTGTLWGWGKNTSGELGDGTSTSHNTPTQVGAYSDWTKIASTWHTSFGIRSNGTLWGTGNLSAILNVADTDTFTQIGSDTNWSDIVCGYEQCYATKTTGQVYVWGYNGSEYCLGLGDTSNRDTPTLINADTDWSLVSAGTYSGLATNGGNITVWGDMFGDYHGVSDQGTAVSVPTTSDFSNTLLTP